MNVLTLAYDFPPGQDTGMGTQIHELATGIARLGVRPTVIVSPAMEPALAAEPAPTERDGVHVHRTKPGVRMRACLEGPEPDAFGALQAQNDQVAEYALAVVRATTRPDVIHCHDFHLAAAGLRLREEIGIPLVTTIHFLLNPLVGYFGRPLIREIADFEQRLCRESDALIAVSHSMAQLIAEHHPSSRSRPIHVIYNGFDAAKFAASDCPDPRGLRQQYGIGEGPFVFYAGRISRQKGVRELLEAAARVLAEEPNLSYVLAGATQPIDPTYKRELESVMDRHAALSSRVHFLGKLPRSRVANLYATAALAVVPSIYEPFGYAATEAMAMGVPVVATRAGGLAEIIEHERSGLLVSSVQFPNGVRSVDIDELTAAQLTLLRNPELATELGVNGKRRVATNFTLADMLQKTRAVYESLARSGSSN